MNRRYLAFGAIALSMLLGIGFAAFGGNPPQWYGPVAGIVIALAWIAVGTFGKDVPKEQ